LIQVSIAKLALSLVYFVIGYTLFASLMAGTGMLGRTAQESAQLSAIWTLTAASPMFFLAAISASPNGMLARAVAVSADRPGHDDDAPRRRRCAGG
jgi:ABC-2 type transport system permease protein